jgi:PAS domain-containing protein
MLWRDALIHRIQAMPSQLPTALLNIAGESLLGFGCRGQIALASPALPRAFGGESRASAELPQPEPCNFKVAESTSGLSSSGTECAISVALGATEWMGPPEQDQSWDVASLYDVGQCQHAEEVIFEPADIIAAAADAIITTTSTGVVTGWNPAAERLCGYSANEVKGQPLFTLA